MSSTAQPPNSCIGYDDPHARPEAGKSLYDADGKFLGIISRVDPDGSVRLILKIGSSPFPAPRYRVRTAS